VTPGKNQLAQKVPARLRTSRRRQVIESSSPTKESQQTQVESPLETSVVSDSQLPQPLPPSSEQPDLRVEITPHSSLDPEQYRLYLASQSIQAQQQSSQQEQVDSGFDESSPISASPQYPVRVRSGIVPDSQSVPNSSSYLPTESKSSSSVIHTSEEDNRGGFIDPRLLKRQPSSVHVSADSDPIVEFSSSQDLSEHFTVGHRQLLEPVVIQDSRRDSRSHYSSSDLHIRSTSSSPEGAVLALKRQSDSRNQTSPGLQIIDTRARPLVSSVFEPDTQGTSGIVQARAGNLTNDSLDREDLQPVLAQAIPNEHNADSLTFQTQVPLPFDDQHSEFAPDSPSTPG